jgi:hypothetical protein
MLKLQFQFDLQKSEWFTAFGIEIASFKGHSNPAKISTAEKEAK